jgi:hypothetical protein
MAPNETAPLQGAHLIASHPHALWTGPVSPASCVDPSPGRCHGGENCLRDYYKLNWPYAARQYHALRNTATLPGRITVQAMEIAMFFCSSAGATIMLLSVQLLHRVRRRLKAATPLPKPALSRCLLTCERCSITVLSLLLRTACARNTTVFMS